MNAKKSTLTRRNFLRSAMIAPVGVALGPTLAAHAEDGAQPPATAAAAGSPPVPTRKFGRNGPEVSMLILGGDLPAYSVEHLEVG